MKTFWILLLSIAIVSCNQNKKVETITPSVSKDTIQKMPVESDGGIGDGAISLENFQRKSIENAHQKEGFLNHKIISFDITLSFGGKERLDGKITMLTGSGKIRIDKKDGTNLIYNGEKVYLCPEDASDKSARFDMFTWSYFFGFPYKLSDSGTKWEMQEDRDLNMKAHSTAKLSFEPGTGDAPKDWYIVYSDPTSKLIQAAAYIVTYGNSEDISKAESDPHMIYYKEYTMIDNIPFATQWEFYGWTTEKGMTDKLGEATISNIIFLEDEGILFDIPKNSKIID